MTVGGDTNSIACFLKFIHLFIINLPQGKEQYKRLVRVQDRVQTPHNNDKTTLQAVRKQ